MARRPAPAVENDGFPARPPLTPADAMRAEGRLPYRHGRSSFLRLTVDVIDRADLDGKDALERLHRFVQDWQHHARAKMLVELGETLSFLVATLPDGEDGMEAQEVRDALEKLDVDALDREERDRRFGELLRSDELVSDLANHYCVNAATAVDDLRKRLIDDAPSADEADAEKAEAKELRKELATLETDRDELMAKVEDLERANTNLRERMGRIFDICKGGAGA